MEDKLKACPICGDTPTIHEWDVYVGLRKDPWLKKTGEVVLEHLCRFKAPTKIGVIRKWNRRSDGR